MFSKEKIFLFIILGDNPTEDESDDPGTGSEQPTVDDSVCDLEFSNLLKKKTTFAVNLQRNKPDSKSNQILIQEFHKQYKKWL